MNKAADDGQESCLAFDVYGTLVDPVGVTRSLGGLAGDQATAFGRLWQDKKVEYAFRRGLMQQYQDFEVCTRQALRYCLKVFNLELTEASQNQLIAECGRMTVFPDVVPGLAALNAKGRKLVAFSNGTETSVRALLGNTRVLPHLEDVISVDSVRSFKPDPRVYEFLVNRSGSGSRDCWMISSNPWDVIGGKAAGLKAAWVQRDPAAIFDPWEFEPDLVIRDLVELSETL